MQAPRLVRQAGGWVALLQAVCEVVQALVVALHASLHASALLTLRAGKGFAQRSLVRRRQFGGGRWRGRPQVGDEIADTDFSICDFVARRSATKSQMLKSVS
jgi:hypothetical protein